MNKIDKIFLLDIFYLFNAQNWSVSHKGEMNSWIRHKICLEFCQIDI